jgi:hypothetical protein
MQDPMLQTPMCLKKKKEKRKIHNQGNMPHLTNSELLNKNWTLEIPR